MKRKQYFDVKKFSKTIKTKRIIRDETDIRTAAKQIDISASTLSRCENGKQMEINTFLSICHWLDVSPTNFFTTKKIIPLTQ